MRHLVVWAIAYKTTGEDKELNHFSQLYDPITGAYEFYATEEQASKRLKFLELQNPGKFEVKAICALPKDTPLAPIVNWLLELPEQIQDLISSINRSGIYKISNAIDLLYGQVQLSWEDFFNLYTGIGLSPVDAEAARQINVSLLNCTTDLEYRSTEGPELEED